MTSIEPDPGVSPVARAARAAGCAFVSLAVWMGVAFAVIQLRGCTGEGMQCLGDAIGIMFLCLLGAAVSMWGLLRLARVRPAWLVALAGPLVFLLLAFGLAGRFFLNVPQLWVVAIMAAYAIGAVLADRRVPARVRWITVGALVVLLVAGLFRF
ncbi:hypothetical protein ACFQZ4_39855 [Catellatospora coxensis]|uniref:Uncharacterized protein n=1 Tax=Catellatospora coxensis TaxID=310354 RepID=A0A8J3L763_9ACTN|nr:hypothetical protein [Catellatospora coxensis]GIG09726.1 hypothetical protein Cco03nite_64260 [Catellatospora coxensis]